MKLFGNFGQRRGSPEEAALAKSENGKPFRGFPKAVFYWNHEVAGSQWKKVPRLQESRGFSHCPAPRRATFLAILLVQKGVLVV